MVAPDVLRPPPDRRTRRMRVGARLAGEIMITLGLIVLLFVFYEVYVTDWFSARKQADATRQLHQRWHDQQRRHVHVPPASGQGFAQLYIPSFGPDFRFTVLEGTDEDTLEAGPAHYRGTALPGQRGNFAVAGHRVGRGAPFNDLDLLRSCDAVVIETADEWYVYRVLPMREERAGWNGHHGDPKCRGVAPMSVPYSAAVGVRIVAPEDSQVIAAVPDRPPSTLPPELRSRLITLTTCHPRFSASQRLIVQGVLTKRYPKVPSRPELRPPELGEM